MSLHGDTKVQLVSGPVRIADLADRTVSSPDFSELVFIWTGTRLYVDSISDVRSVGSQQVFEVELDDESIIKVSASSRFVMRDGVKKLAPELVPGDSLLPLYLEQDVHGYPTYRIPGRDVKQKIYRLMAEWLQGYPLEKGTEVSHIDGNRNNYHPDNLKITPNKRSKKRPHKHKLVTAYKAAQSLLDECAVASPSMDKIVGRGRKSNHRVERITPGALAPVYTASVRSMGSLSVSGVFLDLPS